MLLLIAKQTPDPSSRLRSPVKSKKEVRQLSVVKLSVPDPKVGMAKEVKPLAAAGNVKMKFILLALVLLIASCKPARVADKELLFQDRENKELELVYLEEIREAQSNNDQDAFEFYLREYINVPRLKIPEWMKEDPDYFEGGESVKY